MNLDPTITGSSREVDVPDPSRGGVPPPDAAGGSTSASDLLPYAVPMFAYVGLGSLESYLPAISDEASPLWYPAGYFVKFLIVVMLAWHYRATWADLRPWPRPGILLASAAIGLLVFGIWIGLDGHYPALSILGKRTAFDVSVLAPGWRWAFITVRMLGLVALVPLVEELFWRSFLMRWLIDPDFRKVPIGQVTPVAAAVTSAMFALAHPEWLPALITGAIWAWLLWWTRSVSACLVSHAAANLALGVYVITTGQWKYW